MWKFRDVKINGHLQRWPRPLPGAILIPLTLLEVADYPLRRTCPEVAPMSRPFSTASSPFTMTHRIPSGGRVGSSNVDLSIIVFGSNTTTSASSFSRKIPFLLRPKYYTLIWVKSSGIRKFQLVDVSFIDPIFLS